MDLMKLGTQILASKMSGGSGSGDSAMSALTGLLGDDQGGLDLGSIISKMQGGDLASMASSWIGSGSNQSIGLDQLRSLFGNDKISKFAAQLGTDEDSALGGLAEALPKIVDQGTPDGSSVLDSLGGISSIAAMAKGFLK